MSVFVYTDKGIEVRPSKGAKLPGLFQNTLQAERALDKYMGQVNQAAKQRELNKRSKA